MVAFFSDSPSLSFVHSGHLVILITVTSPFSMRYIPGGIHLHLLWLEKNTASCLSQNLVGFLYGIFFVIGSP